MKVNGSQHKLYLSAQCNYPIQINTISHIKATLQWAGETKKSNLRFFWSEVLLIIILSSPWQFLIISVIKELGIHILQTQQHAWWGYFKDTHLLTIQRINQSFTWIRLLAKLKYLLIPLVKCKCFDYKMVKSGMIGQCQSWLPVVYGHENDQQTLRRLQCS